MTSSARPLPRPRSVRCTRFRDGHESPRFQAMEQRGIVVKAVSMAGLAEEAGIAYKNISDVVEAVDRAGITKKVAELRPIGNIKG